MNRLEFFCYALLSKNQTIKILTRNIYQGIYDLLPRKKNFFYTEPLIYKNSFFGFHDISPLSVDDKYLLAYRLNFDKRMPEIDENIAIGYYEFGKQEFHHITSSYAWNYHKGSRLQWINSSEFIFNDRINNIEYVSKIFALTGIQRAINYPIDAVLFNGNLATSINYHRLEVCMPGYGYALNTRELDSYAPKHDGLFLLDLKLNSAKQLVSLFDLAHEINMANGYYHFVTHTEFSPDGKYIAFMHRWVSAKETNLMNRYSRLMIYDINNNNYFEVKMDHMVSHYVWNSKNQILLYGSKNNRRGHYIVTIDFINKAFDFKYQEYSQINVDGHQSFLCETKYITDTYPDKWRMAHIYYCDTELEVIKELVSVYSPKEFQTQKITKHIACDLHPRISFSKKYITFDSIINDGRCLVVLPITDEIIEKSYVNIINQ